MGNTKSKNMTVKEAEEFAKQITDKAKLVDFFEGETRPTALELRDSLVAALNPGTVGGESQAQTAGPSDHLGDDVADLQDQIAQQGDVIKSQAEQISDLHKRLEELDAIIGDLKSTPTLADAKAHAVANGKRDLPKRSFMVKAVRKGNYKRIRRPGEKFTYTGRVVPSWCVEVDKDGKVTKARSSGMEVSDALKYMATIETIEELDSFVTGDDREGIQSAYAESFERIEDAI